MSYEDELQTVLEQVSEREAKARKRALFYTLIPIVVGTALILITWQQVSKATDKLDTTQSQLVASSQQLSDSQDQISNLSTQLSQTKTELETLKPQVEQLKKDADALKVQVDNNKVEIANLEAQRDNLKDQVEFLSAQVEESKVLKNELYEGEILVTLKDMYEYPAQSQILEEILRQQNIAVWEPGGVGPEKFDSPGFAAYLLNQFGLVKGDPSKIHYSLLNILPVVSTPKPAIGDVVFFQGGYTMFYFQDPSTGDEFVIGMTTFGIIALKYDFAPVIGIRHIEYQ
jgi:hypothetical protein